ncbi:MAG: protein phosphatase 2C domain-containing protein [Thermodesulfobacteriota bacterium]|nr:protein phosphatase 2C domain-containing protein [Thermodesulfobacteriota bacterium]
MVVVESAGITDVGRKRKGNEDALLLDDELGLYVVADGMGGHRAGEVASRLVIETMGDHLKEFREADRTAAPEVHEGSHSEEANRLLSSIHQANRWIHQFAQSNDSYKGMGSTVSAVYFADETLMAANVGDSPIYLVHNKAIELLSVTHTVMAEQEALNPDGANQLGNQFKHTLTRAVGIDETVAPDIYEIPCFKGDILVIASDGLSDQVSPEEILDVVAEERPEKACETLVEMANERGGDDNVTVVVLKVKSVRPKGGRIIGFLPRIFDTLHDVKLLRKADDSVRDRPVNGEALSYTRADSVLDFLSRLRSIVDVSLTTYRFTIRICGMFVLACIMTFAFLLITMEKEKDLLQEIEQTRAEIRPRRADISRINGEIEDIQKEIEGIKKDKSTRQVKIGIIDLKLKALELSEEQEKIYSALKTYEEALSEDLKRLEEMRRKSLWDRALRQ